MKNDQKNRNAWNEKFGFQSLKCDFRTRDMKTALHFLGTKEAVREAAARHWARLKERIEGIPPVRFSIARARAVVNDWKVYGNTPYAKTFIKGNGNIYLASPSFKHRDYNKSVFCENTPSNWEKCELLNRLFEKMTTK